MEQLDFIINGGETRRYHTWPVLRQQRVDEHSFHVAMLCSMMAQDDTDGPGLSVPLLMAALTHDLAEWQMGDLPAPTKRSLPGYDVPGGHITFREAWGKEEAKLLDGVGLNWEAMLSPKEAQWLKIADALQGCLYCIRERQMGNTLIRVPFNNFYSYVTSILYEMWNGPTRYKEDGMERKLVMYVEEMWEQADG